MQKKREKFFWISFCFFPVYMARERLPLDRAFSMQITFESAIYVVFESVIAPGNC